MRIGIVGGGLAGCYFSLLVKEQYPDSVVDVYEVGGGPKSVCAGGLGFFALEKLRKLPHVEKAIKESVEAEIKAFVVGVKDFEKDKTLEEMTVHATNLGRKILGVVLDRKKFDRYFYEKAIGVGVNYYPHTYALPVRGGIKVKDKIISYDYVVDARGCTRFRREDLLYFRQWYDVFPSLSFAEIYFDLDLIRRGYVWVFPGKERVKIGFGEEFSRYNGKIVQVLEEHFDLRGKPFESSALPYRGEVTLYKDGVFHIGTSAGLVDSLTGAGIKYALESAYNLARSIFKPKGPFSMGLIQKISGTEYRILELKHLMEIGVLNYLSKKVYTSNEELRKLLDRLKPLRNELKKRKSLLELLNYIVFSLWGKK